MTKIKKPKKKELVELEKMLRYYHKKGFLELRYINKIVTRKEAEEGGYKPCSYCFGVHTFIG